MPNSSRLSRLGRGVFARNDLRKASYRIKNENEKGLPLIDLSLGSTDISPPSVVIEAIQKSL